MFLNENEYIIHIIMKSIIVDGQGIDPIFPNQRTLNIMLMIK